jgi:hypothetical protein
VSSGIGHLWHGTRIGSSFDKEDTEVIIPEYFFSFLVGDSLCFLLFDD